MKHYSPKPIHVALRRSPLLAGMLVAAGGLACGLLALLPWPLWARLCLMLLVGLASGRGVMCDALRLCARSPLALDIGADGRMRLHTRDGQEQEVRVLGSSYVSGWLTVLNLRTAAGRKCRSVVMLPDTADAEGYRRLRVWLRWGIPRTPGA